LLWSPPGGRKGRVVVRFATQFLSSCTVSCYWVPHP